MVLDFNIKLCTNNFGKRSNIAFFPSKPTELEVEVVSPQYTLAQLAADIAEAEKMNNELVQNKQKNEQRIIEEKVESGVQELQQIAERVNSLAAQLEAEMRHFKDVAVEVNRYYHIQQKVESDTNNPSKKNHSYPLNIWDVHFSSIPAVIKRGNKFIILNIKF
jgi:predicted nucleic acid-binding protein